MIAIILVNWNGHKDTIECLESLLRTDSDNFVTIVVDNGSTDGSIEAIKAWSLAAEAPAPTGPPWSSLRKDRLRPPLMRHVTAAEADNHHLKAGEIVIIDAAANLGFAGGNNLGMRIASMSSDVTHIWLLNNDTVIEPDCIECLVRTSREKPWADLIGARLMYYHQPDLVQGIAGYYRPWVARGGHIGFNLKAGDLPDLKTIEMQMDYVMGASIFLPIATYRRIGPMSEAYFLYFEELDWARRLGKGKQTVALDAVVYHKEGGSIGTDSLGRPSDTSLYYLAVNTLRYYALWEKGFYPVAWVRLLYDLLRYKRDKDAQAVKVLKLAMSDHLGGKWRTGRVLV